MIKNATFLIAYKVFFALLGFSAIITEIAVLLERGTFNPANFFSFFTIESNILVVITLLLSALAISRGRSTQWLDVLRGATTVYILVVGIGFAVLLSGLDNAVLTAVPWDNIVLHYIIPIAVLADFILDRPKRKLSFVRSLTWLLFPLAYAAYSLLRGSIIGWYPYPFLNPATSGYEGVALTVGGLIVLGLILIFLVTGLTWFKKRAKK